VLIVALIVLVIRAIQISTDVKSTSAIMKKRAEELDSYINKLHSTFSDMSETLKGIMASFATFKDIKEKVSKYLENKKDEKEK
jgi:uncharacterized membrane-anchored protein YhcB (DUF1043 family)